MSQFKYDGLDHKVGILEYSSGIINSTKQFVWSEQAWCESRDGSGALVNQYFTLGEVVGGTAYFYTRDHLGSVRDVASETGTIQAQYSYDPYGKVSNFSSSANSDFQFAIAYYKHAPSGLNLTETREYSPLLGRWLNRDSIAESGGINLYCYVKNTPTTQYDPSGLGPEIPIIGPTRTVGGFRNCILGDTACCSYNNNKCHDRCPPCTGLYPTTPSCHACCSGVTATCNSGTGRMEFFGIVYLFRANGGAWYNCAEGGTLH